MDYDLVVIGVNDAAYRLVIEASRLGARVGWWIDQKYDQAQLRYGRDLLASLSMINTNLHSKSVCPSKEHLNPTEANMIGTVVNIRGVDIIDGQRKNQEQNQQKETIEPQAHIYAIASPLTPFPDQVLGLAEHPYVTAAEVFNWVIELQNQDNDQDNAPQLPNSIAILGDDSLACTIAQITNLLGIHTILLASHRHILPHVDVEVARTLQAKLEIAGIAVHTQVQITAVELKDGRSRLWLNRPATIDCDRLLIPYPQRNYPIPNSHNRFSCYSDRDIAQIINKIPNLSQSIVLPTQPIVTVTPTKPPIAQVGLTAAIAQQKYRINRINILETVTTDGGLCKIICDAQNRILGASMYGDRAESVIRALAIAMQGKVKLQELNLPELERV